MDRWLLLIVISVGCLKSTAQESVLKAGEKSSLTLNDAVALALANHPDQRIAQGRVQAATGRAQQAGLWSNPELELSVEDWPTSRGLSESKRLAGVTQTVPFPGKKKLERQISKTDVRDASLSVKLRRLELEHDVKLAFYRALAARRLVDASAELTRVAEGLETSASKRVGAGAAADQEGLRAEVVLDQARSELDARKSELSVALDSLALWIGRTNISAADLIGDLEARDDASVPQLDSTEWLVTHPSMQAAELSRERASLSLRRARLEPYPDVKLGVAGGWEGGTDRSLAQFSIALPLPIIDRSKGRKMEAQADVNIADAQVAATRQTLLRAWKSAVQRHRLAREQFTRCKEVILPKSLEALKLVQAGFEEGKYGFIDLLDTQRTASEARIAYLEKLLELSNARADIELLQGQTAVSTN
jgi:cobalt-zinc-cadmium efflux system outer membrane protein